jgi:nucleoid DNA-binding protein
MKKKSDKIIKDLSLRNNIPVKDVEQIVNSQFLFVKNVMESAVKDEVETFKTIKLLSFGKFLANDKMINHIIKSKNGNISK